MIQRIQTVWLLLVIICGILLVTGHIMAFSGESGLSYTYGFRGFEEFSGESVQSQKNSLALNIMLIVNIIAVFIAIFVYNKRGVQKSLVLTSAIVSLAIQILIIFVAVRTIGSLDVRLAGTIKAALPLVMAAASLLAWKGIDRDDKIVKSYDRLR